MKRRRFLPTLLLMWVGVLVVLLASLCLGRYPITPQTVLRVLVSRFVPIARTWDPTVDTVVWQVRLPRALAAALVGAALSSGGAVFQGLFPQPAGLAVRSGCLLGCRVRGRGRHPAGRKRSSHAGLSFCDRGGGGVVDMADRAVRA